MDGIASKYSVHLEPDRDVTGLKKMWKKISANYKDIEISFPVYNVEVYGNLARVRYDRAILGARAEGGEDYVLVEARQFMVYNLIKENGRWRILGGELRSGGGIPVLL